MDICYYCQIRVSFIENNTFILPEILFEIENIIKVFRHGDRTPDPGELEKYPSAHYNDSVFHPFGKKALTLVSYIMS